MPYIDGVEALRAANINSAMDIPDAQTAKLAIMRPTSHFAILTADNPDMVRTLEEQSAFVEEGLNQLESPLEGEALEAKTKELENAFQRKLAEQARAMQDVLISKMRESGITVAETVEDKGLLEESGDGEAYDFFTDQIFATDVGQFFDDNGQLVFIPAHFTNQQRQGEERLAIAQAENLGAEVRPLVSSQTGELLTNEGGDTRQMPGKKLFFMGQGHRSDPEASQAFAKSSGYHVLPIILLQEQFYHLDCCFLPLPNDAAVIYEGEYQLDDDENHIIDEATGYPKLVAGTETMTPESRAMIRAIYPNEKLILITKNEALAFATNAAVLQANDGRFKMFVNGERNDAISDELAAIETHQLSYTSEHLEQIIEATGGDMDIIETPYKTMHGSGGSIRCTVQEVACTTAALRPHAGNPNYFSERLEAMHQKLESDEVKDALTTHAKEIGLFGFRRLELQQRRLEATQMETPEQDNGESKRPG